MPQTTNSLIDSLEIPVQDKAGNFSFVELRSLEEKHQPPAPGLAGAQVAVKTGSHGPALDSSRPKAKFYMHSEDEQEVAAISAKRQQMNLPSATVTNDRLEAEAENLVKSMQVEVGEELRGRLVKIVFSLLKGIRNPRETREAMLREPSLGGLGLVEQQANEIIDKVAAKKKEIFSKIKGDHLARELSRPTSVPAKPVEDIYETGASQGLRRESGLLTEVKPRAAARTAGDLSVSPESLPRYTPTKKPEVVGPVEEMKLMTLEDFRHLSSDPQLAARRMFQKIDLLADESLELKAQAIKAWKSSPMYQDYLAIGHKSMETGNSVEDIIRAKSVNDMVMKEFEAVADLNKSLQF